MAINKMKRPTMHDILYRAGSKVTKAEKIEVLREYNTLALRDVLKGAFDDSIQFIIPKGVPPFKKASEEFPPSTLRKQTKKFGYFIKSGPGERLPKAKVEIMFIKVLEGIHPDDAALVIKMKDKELEGVYKGITKKLIQEAFPGLIRV